jgi:methylated-DNA-[protein]-cysteine S-methyltransferase
MATLWYDDVPSPLGNLWVAVSARGLFRIDWACPEDEFVGRLRHRGWEPVRSAEHSELIRSELREYFAGQRREFTVALDLSAAPPFHRRALEALMDVPFGQVTTYHDLALRLGAPRASRAVGQAMARNPIPIVVPCHRVLRGDGGLGGFGGGLWMKEYLLRLEGHHRP